MTEADLGLMIQTHGSWILFLLTVIEGPIVTILAGALAGQALLDVPVVLGLAFVGDLLGDCLLYGIGRGLPGLSRRLGHRSGTGALGASDQMRAFVNRRSWQILVMGKWTHALGFAVILAAGAARVPFGLFLLVSGLATVPKVIVLFSLGYAFGQAVDLQWILILALLGAIGIGLVYLRNRRQE